MDEGAFGLCPVLGQDGLFHLAGFYSFSQTQWQKENLAGLG